MHRVALSLLAAGLVLGCGTTTTQVTSRGPGYAPAGYARGGPAIAPIAAGTMMRVALEDSISGRDAAPGQRFTARVIEPVYSADGQLIIEPGAQVLGHVTAIRDADYGGPAAVALSFDAIRVEGYELPLSATIVDTAVQTTGGGEVRSRDVLTGAAIGAVIGSIADFGEGTAIGAGVGAGAGTLVSLGRNRSTAYLPEGTVLTVRLDEPVSYRGYAPRYEDEDGFY